MVLGLPIFYFFPVQPTHMQNKSTLSTLSTQTCAADIFGTDQNWFNWPKFFFISRIWNSILPILRCLMHRAIQPYGILMGNVHVWGNDRAAKISKRPRRRGKMGGSDSEQWNECWAPSQVKLMCSLLQQLGLSLDVGFFCIVKKQHPTIKA